MFKKTNYTSESFTLSDSSPSAAVFDSTIFKLLYPQSNDLLLKINKDDLKEILYHIQNYNLEYRSCLGIDKNTTFGMEIEFEECEQSVVKHELIKSSLYDWNVVNDASLHHGGEINSPILIDNSDTWKNIEEACSIVNKHAYVGKNTSGHIHVGEEILNYDITNLFNFIYIWSAYEKIINRFLYGEKNFARPKINKYAHPIDQLFLSSLDFITNFINNIDDYDFVGTIYGDYIIDTDYTKLNCDFYYTSLIEYFCYDLFDCSRYWSINLQNMCNDIDFIKCEKVKIEGELYFKYKEISTFDAIHTIEFRSPNGTFNPIIWQNNINLICKFLSSCSNNLNAYYDEKIIQRATNVLNTKRKSKMLDIDGALELCDMIFDNNLDKVYFLRQYLKDYKIENSTLKNKIFKLK